MNADMSRDDMHGLSVSGGESSSGGGASPLTARSIRLERFAQALANSQEELRRWVDKSFHFHFHLNLISMLNQIISLAFGKSLR